MIPTITPVPVRGFKSDSGLANVCEVLSRKKIAPVPTCVVRQHRNMCWYAITSVLVTALAIVFFVAGCIGHAHAQDIWDQPAPVDYPVYICYPSCGGPAASADVFKIPPANTEPTPEPAAGVMLFLGLGGVIYRHRRARPANS